MLWQLEQHFPNKKNRVILPSLFCLGFGFWYNRLLVYIVWRPRLPWSVTRASFVAVYGSVKCKGEKRRHSRGRRHHMWTLAWSSSMHCRFFKSSNHKTSKTHFRPRDFYVYTDSLPSRVLIVRGAALFSCICPYEFPQGSGIFFCSSIFFLEIKKSANLEIWRHGIW